MKKILALFLCGILVPPAIAEVSPYYFYDDVDYVDEYGNTMYVDEYGNFYYPEDVVEEAPAPVVAPVTTSAAATTTGTTSAPTTSTSTVAKTAVSPRVPTGRTTPASRATAPTGANQRVVSRGISNTSATAARPTTSRTATTTQSRGMVTTAPSRASVASITPSAVTITTAPTGTAKVSATSAAARRATDTNRTVTARAGLLQEDTINQPLYIGTNASLNTERVASRPTVIVGTSMTSRAPSLSNTATATGTTSVGTSAATATAEEMARLTGVCREQFYSCMDNYCDVLDETQGRCVCSSNAEEYKEIEDALKNATESLQDVAQKIQYIGLTKDEIEAIFKQTEAEAAMVGQRDTSQIQADLDKIRKMIIEVDAETYSTNNFSFLLDVDFTFDNGFNLYDWLMGINGSVLRQRGTELYTSALSKCRTNVLDACKKNGIDTSLITTGYDLEIDRQCIAYEKVLDDENDQMKRTVRNATNVLQKARLVIAQNKNVYDLRGCVNALDSCMQDDFACGADYEYCLDPTGKYIADGEVIVGSLPGFFDAAVIPTDGLYKIWNYSTYNAWGNTGSVDEYITNRIKSTSATDMVGFLQAKIGANDGTKNTGMCMSVLNQCQDYTYTAVTRAYNPNNDVVRQYLMRSLATIKAHQDEIVAEFAASCITRINSCLTSNGAISGYDNTNKGSVSYASYNACRSLISSCGSVNNDPTGVNVIGSALCYLGKALPNVPVTGTTVDCP